MQTVMEQRPKKLLDQLREVIRRKHYSTQTEETYVFWVKRYILFHNKRHPLEMGSTGIETFLTYLAVDQKVRGINPKPGSQCFTLPVSSRAQEGRGSPD